MRHHRRPPLTLQHIAAECAEELAEIEDLVDGQARATYQMLHRKACERECDQYVDPASGYKVFTAHHLGKRPCCGNRCRHCPWAHRNVPKK